MNLRAAVVELFQNRVGNGAADAAAHHADLLLALRLGRTAQRANEIVETIALLLVAQLFSSGTHRLNNDGNGTLLAVIVMDRNGDTLTILIHAQNDELSGLRLLGHHGCLDLIEDHGRFQRFLFHDAIHTYSLISVFSFPAPFSQEVPVTLFILSRPFDAVNAYLLHFFREPSSQCSVTCRPTMLTRSS